MTSLARSLTALAAAGFFAFICWIIYLADTGATARSIFSPLFKIGYGVRYADKIGHFTLFGLLAFAVNAAFRFRQVHLGRKLRRMYLGSLLVISFVLLEELSQHFFPRRTLDLFDLLADGAGIALFTWISGLLDSKIRQRNAPPPPVSSSFRLDSGFPGLYSPICLAIMKQQSYARASRAFTIILGKNR